MATDHLLVTSLTSIYWVLALIWTVLMYSETDIISKAWLVTETVNLMLSPKQLVHKVFLIGSYANGTADEWSDIDLLVQLKVADGKIYPIAQMFYPTAEQMHELNITFKPDRIHVIFGTEEAQRKLNKPYKELKHGDSHRTTV